MLVGQHVELLAVRRDQLVRVAPQPRGGAAAGPVHLIQRGFDDEAGGSVDVGLVP
jgi:hypothetical protein